MCAPTKRTRHNPFGITDHAEITEDERKDAATIARGILRRLLPRCRALHDETAARYAVYAANERWERDTRAAIVAAVWSASQTERSELVYLRSSAVTGKATASATYGVHLDLYHLSREQALHILDYLEANRE